MVPICSSGLSILMAVFLRVGGEQALFLVVPLFGALLVGAVYVLGASVAPRVGLAAAALAAASPVFLFQLVQPMSDVPAAALWCVAAALVLSASPRSALLAGLATSLAILVRPNLLPLGVALGLAVLLRPRLPGRDRLRAATTYALGSAPGCLAVALIQQYFYGSPLSSGYGSAEGLFALDHVGPNMQRYLTWFWETETPLCLLALAAPVVCRRWSVTLCTALIVVNLACYLPYVVFEEWSFLRFLLPTLPLVLLLSVGTLDWILVRLTRIVGGRAPGAYVRSIERNEVIVVRACLAAVTVAAMVAMLRTAEDRSVFALASLESRFARAGKFVATRLPENAAVITSWESGSVTYYGGRQTIVWDVLDPGWLDRTITFLRGRGLEPYVLVERWEEPIFRKRFEGNLAATLDWPPSAEIGGLARIYRPDDRARYQAGERVVTEYVR
jgi:hypothetical protein